MTRRLSRKLALSAAAAAVMFGVGAPAFAGGGHVSVGYHSGYYGGGYYGGGYRGHHGYYGGRRHHRRHRGGGGKGAAIALGVIGGAIIINELAEQRVRDRYYRDRYYEDRYYDRRARYDRYARRAAPYPEEEYASAPADTELDQRLEGGREDNRSDGGPEPIRVSYSRAYDACLRHAREALGNRGFVLSAPYKPETAEDLGGPWKMTATVTAQKGSEGWSRAMYCEADDRKVYLLELI